MKISLRLLAGFALDVEEYQENPQKLADILTNAGLEVEGIQDASEQFKNVVIGKILEKNKHPNADQLTLCLVDTGSAQHKIVCGAKNHNAGDVVVVALPGAVLPGNFAIKVSKIRGEESSGMLCSEKELGLKSESEGILILPASAPIGESFAKYFKMDDIILDVKVTPNRADCLSHFGIVREISALTGKPFQPLITPFEEGRDSTKKIIKVNVEDSERCPRYAGRVVKNVKVGPSPEWLTRALESLGLRSISNVVDITNYVMMTLGQPLHAFDLTKIKDAQIIVRGAKAGEAFEALDEKKLELQGSELVIADSAGPVALAGVMGGLHSGVSETTKDVFIESAIFNAASVRRTSKMHGMESDSSYRFSRGVDPEGVLLALNRCCQLLADFAGGSVCSDFYDIYPRPLSRPRIELDLKFISARLGFVVDSTEAKKIMERVGCAITGSGDKLLVNPPPFRSDLKLAEDLAEEILRFKGFSYIPETLPTVTTAPQSHDREFVLEQNLCDLFIGEGFSQSINLSLSSSEFQKKVLKGSTEQVPSALGFDLDKKNVEIINPLNNELNILRSCLFPSLIKNVQQNTRYGNTFGRMFEVSPVFMMKESEDFGGKKPFHEELHLAAVIWGTEKSDWMKLHSAPAFFDLKGAIENFFFSWKFKSYKFQTFKEAPTFLHPGKSAQIVVEGKVCGFLGIIHPELADSLDLKTETAICEINLKQLLVTQPRAIKSREIPKFPSVERDVALLVPGDLPAGDVRSELLKATVPLGTSCEIFDLYSGENLPPNTRSVALRVTYQDLTRTLLDEEINAMHQKAVQAVCSKLQLTVR